MRDLLFSSESLPLFSKIKTADIKQAISEVINNSKTKLTKIKQHKTWEEFALALEEVSIELSNAWAPVKHLNSVVSNEQLRKVYEECLQEIVQYSLLIEQDEQLYLNYKNIYDTNKNLTSAQVILLKNKLRDFQLSGVDLDPEKKAEYKKISTELSTLSNKFNNNVMDCTDKWTYHIEDESMLIGIPKEIIAMAAERGFREHKIGWLFGLDAPTYLAIMKSAANRDVRAAFHYAYATRASTQGPHSEEYDNSNVMFEIFTKRHQLAKLLGLNNYAEYSLVSKMIKKPELVIDFLRNLISQAKEMAEREWNELRLFIKKTDSLEDIKPWDITYYSELQKNKLYNLSEDELKKYFPLEKVLSGFIIIIHKLYNIKLEVYVEADCWHQDVICYKILDNNSKIIGYVYLDLYARLRKRNGAWMDECRVRCFTDNIKQIPVAYLTCNFTPPNSNGLALLTHTEVLTLFHEFGHCLHHLLTKVDYPSISGINGVPWDAVELPSQFHENWCWSSESIALISGHYETGDPLPEKYLKELSKQKNYQAGLFLLRQLIFGLFDFRIHLEFKPEESKQQIQKVLDEVRAEVSVLPIAEYDQFQHSFSHIFAGGYAAGYYSYLWAEVLSSNCFEKFQRAGIFDKNTSSEFLNKILSQGGSIDINQAMVDFCGHDIKVEPLLKQYGLIN
ncbi:MAG: M3 family metallopeptidase [Gammaproteobacteria bacterium]|nr:M3 family metallopeptidase [Gammaproteobacteria bacterium]